MSILVWVSREEGARATDAARTAPRRRRPRRRGCSKSLTPAGRRTPGGGGRGERRSVLSRRSDEAPPPSGQGGRNHCRPGGVEACLPPWAASQGGSRRRARALTFPARSRRAQGQERAQGQRALPRRSRLPTPGLARLRGPPGPPGAGRRPSRVRLVRGARGRWPPACERREEGRPRVKNKKGEGRVWAQRERGALSLSVLSCQVFCS